MTVYEIKLSINLQKQHKLLEQYHNAQQQYKNFELNHEQFNNLCDDIFADLQILAEQQEILEQFEQDDPAPFNKEDLPF